MKVRLTFDVVHDDGHYFKAERDMEFPALLPIGTTLLISPDNEDDGPEIPALTITGYFYHNCGDGPGFVLECKAKMDYARGPLWDINEDVSSFRKGGWTVDPDNATFDIADPAAAS